MRTSRTEKRLAAAIAKAPSPLRADCLRAELAAYQARLGHFAACRESLAALRLRNGPRPAVELSVWLHLAEGLLDYFHNSGFTKADGMQRAHALATAAGLVDLKAMCAAWLAQWDFATANWPRMRDHLNECFSTAHASDHASRARACLVAAQALHLAGRIELARVWYQRSRDHALRGADDATIAALMYNMSRHRMLLLRRSVLTRSNEPDAGEHALLSAESTARFDLMVGQFSWQPLKAILRAQILSLKGEPSQALALYERSLGDEAIPGRWQANLLADKAWCCASIGRLADARACAAEALESVTPETHGDDLGAMHSRLSQVFEALDEPEHAARHAASASRCWADFAAVQAEAVRLVAGIDESGLARDPQRVATQPREAPGSHRNAEGKQAAIDIAGS